MRYADYYDCDICNGNHVGMSLFVSGCPFHCQGCFNSDSWDFNSGKEWTEEVENTFIKLAGRDYIRRITFLGGSPLCDDNVSDVANLIRKLRNKYPEKEIWIYTGYSWESIWNGATLDSLEYAVATKDRRDAVSMADVLVDGRFELENRDITLAFKGSSNQRVIDVQQSLSSGEVILWNKNCEGH